MENVEETLETLKKETQEIARFLSARPIFEMENKVPMLPTPVSISRARSLYPVIKIRKKGEYYIFSGYGRDTVRSYFLTLHRIKFGLFSYIASEKIDYIDVAKFLYDLYGEYPIAILKIYRDGQLVATDYATPDNYYEKLTMWKNAGYDVRVLAYFRGRIYTLHMLKMKLLEPRFSSPNIIFPKYVPPRWFIEVAYSKGLATALKLYSIYIALLAPEQIRKMVFLRIVKYLYFLGKPFREISRNLFNEYLTSGRVPSPEKWVPYIPIIYIRLVKEHGLMQTVNEREFTSQDMLEIVNHIRTYLRSSPYYIACELEKHGTVQKRENYLRTVENVFPINNIVEYLISIGKQLLNKELSKLRRK